MITHLTYKRQKSLSMVDVLAIRRDDKFSPNSVEVDRQILQAVIDRLPHTRVRMKDEAALTMQDEADVYLFMGRLPQVISILKDRERDGKRVIINRASSLERCSRSSLEQLMQQEGIPVAPRHGDKGYWVKRGDATAQTKDDVRYCADEEEVKACLVFFAERGIRDIVVNAHVEGDLIKFYGVGSNFFRFYYPTEGGRSKFGDEARNGEVHHYEFDVTALQKDVFRLAEAVGIEVYGGDCIVDRNGNYYIIDFNDWPSFSRCRDEAASAIAELVNRKIEILGI